MASRPLRGAPDRETIWSSVPATEASGSWGTKALVWNEGGEVVGWVRPVAAWSSARASPSASAARAPTAQPSR
ncbi:hypothetical protein [Streptomyces xylophagus]|uniref:hypothetical protein n=1 Tax=Streptomyces xylophagus TaxID=285514 RepID=UPI00131D5685|nr:hypothetical protein [Streptomyces xylophagus]